MLEPSSSATAFNSYSYNTERCAPQEQKQQSRTSGAYSKLLLRRVAARVSLQPPPRLPPCSVPSTFPGLPLALRSRIGLVRADCNDTTGICKLQRIGNARMEQSRSRQTWVRTSRLVVRSPFAHGTSRLDRRVHATPKPAANILCKSHRGRSHRCRTDVRTSGPRVRRPPRSLPTSISDRSSCLSRRRTPRLPASLEDQRVLSSSGTYLSSMSHPILGKSSYRVHSGVLLCSASGGRTVRDCLCSCGMRARTFRSRVCLCNRLPAARVLQRSRSSLSDLQSTLVLGSGGSVGVSARNATSYRCLGRRNRCDQDHWLCDGVLLQCEPRRGQSHAPASGAPLLAGSLEREVARPVSEGACVHNVAHGGPHVKVRCGDCVVVIIVSMSIPPD